MVYSRLVDGYGPYLYRSEREGQTIHSIYVGKGANIQTQQSKLKPYTTTNKSLNHDGKEVPSVPRPTLSLNRRDDEPQIPKEKLKIAGKSHKQTIMTHLERLHLEAYRRKLGLDKAEIDNRISYEENKQYLEDLAGKKGMGKDEIAENDKEGQHWLSEYKKFKKLTKEEASAYESYMS